LNFAKFARLSEKPKKLWIFLSHFFRHFEKRLIIQNATAQTTAAATASISTYSRNGTTRPIGEPHAAQNFGS
jgi:hypothetical protein